MIAAKGIEACDQPLRGRDIVVVQAADKLSASLVDSTRSGMACALGLFHEKPLFDPCRVKKRHHMPNVVMFIG
jgi:hypothetical protein